MKRLIKRVVTLSALLAFTAISSMNPAVAQEDPWVRHQIAQNEALLRLIKKQNERADEMTRKAIEEAEAAEEAMKAIQAAARKIKKPILSSKRLRLIRTGNGRGR
jgi:hypothetical protein